MRRPSPLALSLLVGGVVAAVAVEAGRAAAARIGRVETALRRLDFVTAAHIAEQLGREDGLRRSRLAEAEMSRRVAVAEMSEPREIRQEST